MLRLLLIVRLALQTLVRLEASRFVVGSWITWFIVPTLYCWGAEWKFRLSHCAPPDPASTLSLKP